jgi:hypothetical protein
MNCSDEVVAVLNHLNCTLWKKNMVSRGIAPFLTSTLDGSEWWASSSGRLPPGRRAHWHPMEIGLGGLWSRSGRCGKEESNPLALPGIQPGSVVFPTIPSPIDVWTITNLLCESFSKQRVQYLVILTFTSQHINTWRVTIYTEPLTGNGWGELTDTCTVWWRNLGSRHESLGKACLHSLFCLSSRYSFLLVTCYTGWFIRKGSRVRQCLAVGCRWKMKLGNNGRFATLARRLSARFTSFLLPWIIL